MSVIGSNALAGASGQAAGGYNVERSLRFNSSDSAFLSRTPSTAGNQQTFSISFWTKLASIGSFTFISSQSGNVRIGTSTNNVLAYDITPVSGSRLIRTTTAVLRDPSAWYHILFSVNTTSATQEHRFRAYVNGVEVLFDVLGLGSGYLPQNSTIPFNNTSLHEIGRRVVDNDAYLNGYLADVHFIDGQALTPSSFTEVSATTGQLIPKAYTGTFGTNGFWLKFSDNSNNTAATLGKDYSPNGNNWTPNNLSVTAGAGNDSLVDTPTSYGTDDGLGGSVRGNYATLNPLVNAGLTLSNGNLDFTSTLSNRDTCIATHGVSSGKWYWEYTVSGTDYSTAIGIEPAGYYPAPDARTGNDSAGYAWWLDRQEKYHNGSFSSYGAAVSSNAVIGVALDLDGGSLTFYLNGSTQGSAYTGISGTYLPSICDCANGSTGGSSGIGAGSMNFGQRQWAYAAPAGFKALCDTNLPAPVVAKPSEVMDVVTYTGNGTTQTISGLGFSPDFVWLKRRSSAQAHYLYDVIRGTSSVLYSDGTDAEQSITTGLTAFNSDGFSLGSLSGVNASSTTNAAWCWDAGTTTTTINANAYSAGVPSITSSVRADTSAGFSIVTWSYGTVDATVGHGLGVAPSMIIAKARTGASSWIVYHSGIGTDKYIYLNQTAAAASNIAGVFSGNSSTVFEVNSGLFPASVDYVAYCFAPVAGYSSALSWTGNGSSDGPLLHCGFSPRFFIAKRTDAANDWWMWDTARSNTGNPVDEWLSPNRSDAEYGNDADFDFLSNGIKIRNTSATVNASGGSYIGFAWASNPFQYARAQ